VEDILREFEIRTYEKMIKDADAARTKAVS
jgi:hypothetical protein